VQRYKIDLKNQIKQKKILKVSAKARKRDGEMK
jgi:hypothetical protein